MSSVARPVKVLLGFEEMSTKPSQSVRVKRDCGLLSVLAAPDLNGNRNISVLLLIYK